MIFHEMRIHFKSIMLFIWIALISASSGASTLHAVNVVKVAVSDQTEKSRRNALDKAFTEVILRMSGDRNKFNSRDLKNYSASEYLKAYQYEVNSSQLIYVASFDTAKVQQLLKQLSLPIWEARRPDTILWLSADSLLQSNSTILAENDTGVLPEIVNKVAEERGIDVALPIMDIEDSAAVSSYDVWGRFLTPILKASTRYQINHVIIARIRATPEYNADALEQRIEANQEQREEKDESTQLTSVQPLTVPSDSELFEGDFADQSTPALAVESNQPKPAFAIEEFNDMLSTLQPYLLDYTFYIAGIPQSKTLAGESPQTLLAEMLHRYSDQLSQRYALQLGQFGPSKQITLQVNNVDSLRKYAQVFQFLNTLTLVDSVILVQQVGKVAQFQVNLLSDRERLIDTLLLDGRLMPLVNDFGEVIDDTQFYWQQ